METVGFMAVALTKEQRVKDTFGKAMKKYPSQGPSGRGGPPGGGAPGGGPSGGGPPGGGMPGGGGGSPGGAPPALPAPTPNADV